jgi:hypothetical protein
MITERGGVPESRLNNPVSEPSTLILLGSALFGLGLSERNLRNRLHIHGKAEPKWLCLFC